MAKNLKTIEEFLTEGRFGRIVHAGGLSGAPAQLVRDQITVLLRDFLKDTKIFEYEDPTSTYLPDSALWMFGGPYSEQKPK